MSSSSASASTTSRPSTTAASATASPPSAVRPSTAGPATTAATTPPASSAPAVAPLSAAARRAGLVDVRTVVPDAVVDLRYATSANFTHVRLYPAGARCLVHTSMRSGLRTAAARLRQQGYRLVFWDCYRPHPVQVQMFRIVPDPEYVARPGPYARSHESGRSIDVTLAHARPGTCTTRVQGHCLLGMGTGFDDFSDRAHAYATDGVGAGARAHRAILRAAMLDGGLAVYVGEWWHFDGPGADVGRPFLDAPLH
ncbi:M15 family metallopeptidase [uncultured Jatrophihabitans sp.]|uniref:M15 family metallopeptidase n=1 Tax=uncultured Jatrophihabitans sp. TaxID=1610747 RepID=UPI0035CBA1F2